MDTDCIIGCLPIQLEKGHCVELQKLIAELPDIIFSCNNSANDLNFSRFEKLIQLYSEEPHLLDSVLPQFVNELLSHIQWSNKLPLSQLSIAVLDRLYVLTRIRGYKIMIRLLPHEVTYLEKLLVCLEYYANKTDLIEIQANARIVFMLTAWLLIICKNPFNLTKFDNLSQQDEKPMAQRIIDCLNSLHNLYILHGEMAIISTLLAQILTRNDNNFPILLPRILDAIEIIKLFDSETDGGRNLISTLRLLISFFKWGKRKEMKMCADLILNAALEKLLNVECLNITVRYLVIKLLQRIALVLLRPRLADWRYKCGYRSLEASLKGQNIVEPQVLDYENLADVNMEEDYEVPFDLIEKLISELLNKVNNRDNIVRWAAAKGIARICARLNREMAAEVVSVILASSFDLNNSGTTWHGGCLAIAELCRRGCLLPDQVPEVITKVLLNAFCFEQSFSGFAVSVNVRDAACYICWAFARAYETKVLKSCLPLMSGDLVSMALFDREVNIRRAASAAFQENVGRNNCFFHGIEILTIINYSDVSLIRNCYLNLSVRVANYEEYRRPMLDNLFEFKSQHWDENIRELSADTFSLLVEFDWAYTRSTILPKLCARLKIKDFSIKHGTLFALAGILHGLNKVNELHLNTLPELNLLLEFVHNNLALVENHRVKGYFQLAKGLCRFIQVMCGIKAPLSDNQLIEYHEILDLIISDKNKLLHSYAINAFDTLMKYYNNQRFDLFLNRIFNKYFPNINNRIDEVTCLSAIAPLSYIDKKFLSSDISTLNFKNITAKTLAENILSNLTNIIFDVSVPKWVFARVAAIKCISDILLTFVPVNYDFSTIIDSFIYSTDDYTTSVNGDIGWFTRKAAVNGLVQVLPIAYNLIETLDEGSEKRIFKAFGSIIQRCCEPIDDLRSTACSMIAVLLNNNKLKQLNIPNFNLLQELFLFNDSDSDSFKTIDWMHAKGFLRLVPLLGSVYHLNALEGFILSSGNLSEWTSQNAYAALTNYLKQIKKDASQLEIFLQDLIKVYERILKRNCDVSPILLFFQMSLNDRIFSIFEDDPDKSLPFTNLTTIVIKIALGRGKPKLKCLAISIMGSLLHFNAKSKLYHNCLIQIISFLQSPYISLREVALEQIFQCLSAIKDEELACKIYDYLKQIPWNNVEKTDQLINAKEELLKLFTF